jgi:hypothetical protein
MVQKSAVFTFLLIVMSREAVVQGAPAEPVSLTAGDLTLVVDAQQKALSLADRRTGRVWRCDAPVLTLWIAGEEYLPRELQVSNLAAGRGLGLRFGRFQAASKTSALTIAAEALLCNDGVRFRLLPVDSQEGEAITHIDFPRRFGKTDDAESGYLVLPCGLGGIRPFSRRPFRWDTALYANGSHGPNLAMLGKVLVDSPSTAGPALLAIFHTPFDCRLRIDARDFTPRWDMEPRPTLLEGTARRLQVNYQREIEYRFLPRARYVDLAKAYRAHLVAAGRFRSLRDRLPVQPELAAHCGAIIKKQYAGPVFDNGEIARARELGVHKCVWFAGGWNFGGYDRLYPQRLPPNPDWRSPDGQRGADGLRRTVALARAAGYVFSVHDNYSDAYRDSADWEPAAILTTQQGTPRKGGMWGGGQAWIICPHEQVRYAQRDLAKVAELIGRGGYFIDVTGAAGPQACFDAHHPCDRRQAAELKRELLGLAQRTFGAIYTEGIFDFLIPEADGCHKIFIPTGDPKTPSEDVVPVPLLPLVYHDAIVLWDVRRMNPERARKPKAAKTVPLGPYVPLYGLAPATLDAESKRIADTMAGTQTAEMLDHRFLAPGVEATTYADGTQVLANFAEHAQRAESHQIPARGYVIVRDGRVQP